VRPRHVYLDWNATTPPHPDVVAAMRSALEEAWANPASAHGPGRRSRDRVEGAREAVAALVGFDARDVVLTSGGTEANNLALSWVAARATGQVRGLVTSRLEHPSVTRTAEHLEAGASIVEWAEPSSSGVVSPDAVETALERALARGARELLVALQAVNHETGVLQPIGAVAERVRRRGALLHVDAVQAVGRLEPDAWAGADLVAVAAHKIRGPKGVGALALRPGLRVGPVLFGGSQERGVRPGTQDPVACAGFAVAARRARATPGIYAALASRRDAFEAALVALGERSAGAPLRNGDGPRAPHVANLSWPGWRGEELCAALDLEGIAVSAGSACSAGTAETSPVLTAMLGERRAGAAVRVSLGEDTTASELDAALAAWGRVLDRAR
jgi:cysteine desulfurase